MITQYCASRSYWLRICSWSDHSSNALKDACTAQSKSIRTYIWTKFIIRKHIKFNKSWKEMIDFETFYFYFLVNLTINLKYTGFCESRSNYWLLDYDYRLHEIPDSRLLIHWRVLISKHDYLWVVMTRVATCPELCGTVPQTRSSVLRPAQVSCRTHLSCISMFIFLKW
jgi:hypothetical protein